VVAVRRRRTVRVANCGELRAAGFALLDTTRHPLHFSIVLADLTAATFDRLRPCFSNPMPNPGYAPYDLLMDPSQYEIWVDDHNIDDDGNIVGLVRHAGRDVDPQVGKSFLVGDGEQEPFRATVIERTRDGLITLRADDEPSPLRTAGGRPDRPPARSAP